MVEQHVQAPVLGIDELEHLLDLGHVADVDLVGDTVADATGLDQLDGLVGSLEVPVGDDDGGAFGRHLHCARAAHARAGAGDERDSVF